MEKIRKNKKVIAVFLIPAVLIYLCFELIPVVMSVYFSFNDWPGLQAVPLKFVGFKNYAELLTQDTVFRSTVWHTIIYTIINVAIQVVAECSYLRCCKCYFAGSYWIWTWITDPSFQKRTEIF